jgi:hypothetical protein
MNRGTFITTLAGGAFALPQALAAAETPDEKSIYDALDAVIDAQFSSEFQRLATLLHPSSMGLFRNVLSARFDQLLRYYTNESISAVSGLPNHPKDLKLSDEELFTVACNAVRDRHPEFVGSPKTLPLTVHGTIFERESLGYVLFSFAGNIHTERTDFDFIQPRVFTFDREGGPWLLRTCWLAQRVAENWWMDLSGQKRTEAEPK